MTHDAKSDPYAIYCRSTINASRNNAKNAIKTLFISIYFQSHLIKIKIEMYCFKARLAFITCSNQAKLPVGRIILQ